MIKKLKYMTVQMIAGANMASVILMLLSGYSDRLNPTDNPILSTIGMTFPVLLVVNMAFLVFWLVFKWRMAWISVAGFFLAYVPISIYIPIHPFREVPDKSLKLISYNVCSYGGNHKYEKGFEMIRDYLTKEKPDIVCLQEDVDTWRKYVFRDYERFLPYNDTMTIAKSALCHNVLGIHTRFPILRRERIEYNSVSNGSVAWWLKIDGDTVIVVNNHFESCHLDSIDRRQYRQIIHGEMSGDSVRSESKLLLVKLAEGNALRAAQIRKVRDYAKANSRYPVIVCGDFNDNPISYSRHAMSEALTDCYVETGNGIGLSYNQKAFALRIDHVFCNEKVTPYQCVIDDKMDASDHNPVLCWLKIRPNH